jgi:NAD(P)-dependent dehydrogenase (short-subunit alcohol dehydrogenase family)
LNIFTDKTAVVTGGASGLGYSLCWELAALGAKVVVTDINKDGARKTAENINNAKGTATAVYLDVADSKAVRTTLMNVADQYGSLDYMFNNAGIAVGAEAYDLNEKIWDNAIAINLMGVAYGSTEAYKIMRKQGRGHIINISSLAGLIGYPTALPYATAKSGIIGLSLSLHYEAKAQGINVTVVCPGFVKTRLLDDATVINADNKDVVPKIPFKMMEPKAAAQKILQGISQHKKIMIFPFYARLLWWLYRIHPTLVSPLADKLVQDFRAVKK